VGGLEGLWGEKEGEKKKKKKKKERKKKKKKIQGMMIQGVKE